MYNRGYYLIITETDYYAYESPVVTKEVNKPSKQQLLS